MIAHMLEASGLTVGMFTSPYIMRFNERIQINHVPIPDADLVDYGEQVFAILESLQAQDLDYLVTEFEFITALAFLYFAAKKVDVSVIEVGIGGDTDSTNVLTPVVSVITSVGLDHAALLGDSLSSVARHKAGIIKAGAPVVTAELPTEAQAEIAEQAAQAKSQQYIFGRDFAVTDVRQRNWAQSFDYQDAEGSLKRLKVPLIGDFQTRNAALALQTVHLYAAARGLKLNPADLRKGLLVSRWPVRLEKVSDEPLIVLDGAHNPQGMRALVDNLKRLFGHSQLTLIVGVLGDKAAEGMLRILAELPGRLYLVPVPDNARAVASTTYLLPKGVRAERFDSWQSAFAAYLQMHADEPLIVTGSLYLASAVRQTLLEENDD